MSAFDLNNGEVLTPPAEKGLETFSTKVENEKIWVKQNK